MSAAQHDPYLLSPLIGALYQLATDADAWLVVVDCFMALDEESCVTSAGAQDNSALETLLQPHVQQATQIASSRQTLHVERVAASYASVLLDRRGVVVQAPGGPQVGCLPLEVADAQVGQKLRVTVQPAEFGHELEDLLVRCRDRGAVLLKFESRGQGAPQPQGFGLLRRVESQSEAAAQQGTESAVYEVLVPRQMPELPHELLRAEFGLTGAEIRVAGLLAQGLSLREVSSVCDVAEATVRNQIKSIFRKTDVNRQPDLVRLLLELGLLASASKGLSVDEGSGLGTTEQQEQTASESLRQGGHAFGARHFITLSDGRKLCYRPLGDLKGRPLLVCHNGLGSIGLFNSQIRLLQDMRLCWIDVERPGYGHSSRHPDYSFTSVAQDFAELVRQLDLQDVHVLAGGGGLPYALALAQQLPERISAITVCAGRPAGCLEPESNLRNAPGSQLRALLRRQSWFVEGFFDLYRIGYNLRSGSRFLKRATSHSPHDVQLADDEETANYSAEAFSEIVDLTAKGLADDLRAFYRCEPIPVRDVTCPIIAWHGVDDPHAPIETLQDYLQDSEFVEFHTLEQTGHMVMHRHWQQIIRRIAQS